MKRTILPAFPPNTNHMLIAQLDAENYFIDIQYLIHHNQSY